MMLTNPRFLEKYKSLCKPNGWFKFKTDSTSLFEYTLEVLENEFKVNDLIVTKDLYKDEELLKDHHGIKTKYEKIWTAKGENIKYLKFRF